MDTAAEKIRVLLLDDDPVVHTFLGEVLAGEYHFIQAFSRTECIDLLAQTRPHILLLDVMLPDGNGLDICSHLRESGEYPDLFVVIITSSTDLDIVEDSYRRGADDLIHKPLIPIEIRSKMAIFSKAIRARERLRISNDTLAAINKEYRDELARIRKIQVTQLPRFDRIAGYKIATTYLPAQELSGDFIDGFFIDDETYQIVLCDVSGHGMASSYVGTAIRTLLRTTSVPERSLSSVMTMVNDSLCVDLKGLYYFATIIICRLNMSDGSLEYLNAGHPPPILNRAGTRKCIALHATGSLVGLFTGHVFNSRRIIMSSGDTLLLYTDGVTEARNDLDDRSDDNMFGLKRLAVSYLENRDNDVRDIIHSIVGTVYEFSDYREQEDDITVLCIRKR